MKKLSLIFFSAFLAVLFFAAQPVLAADLQITKIGTVDVSSLDLGDTLGTYTYAGGTFEMAGTASPSAMVSIVIDDVTKTATTDTLGNWTSLISSLTTGDHDFTVSSNLEILDFTLTIGSASATSTATGGATSSASVTTTSASTTTTLPEAGSLSMSLLTLASAMFVFGLGVLLKAKKL